MKHITRHIPNAITCCNLLSGCIAIVMAFKGLEPVGSLLGWQWACIFIGAAAVFDFADGAAARALKAYSKIGAELDSLSDLVSFGVAPAMLIINLMEAWGGATWSNYLVLLVPVCGALRLARFNVEDVGTTSFRGLPIPANAIFLIGLAGWINSYGYPGGGVCIILSWLSGLAMLGKFSMFSLKFKNFSVHQNLRRYVIIVAAVVFVAMYGLCGLAWTIVLYALISLLSPHRNG